MERFSNRSFGFYPRTKETLHYHFTAMKSSVTSAISILSSKVGGEKKSLPADMDSEEIKIAFDLAILAEFHTDSKKYNNSKKWWSIDVNRNIVVMIIALSIGMIVGAEEQSSNLKKLCKHLISANILLAAERWWVVVGGRRRELVLWS
jgi:hypothetical protein